MAITDIFKKKKEEVKKEETVKTEKAETPKLKKKSVLPTGKILIEPHISERATDLQKEDQYIFKVYSEANKIEIKKAVESLYNIDVLGVNIIRIPEKKRRLGRTYGVKKGYKKAIVKIKKGQKIELL